MKTETVLTSLSLTLCLTLTGRVTPGYNQKIPEQIMTPDKVETRLGTLNFVGPLGPWFDKSWKPGEIEEVN